MSGPKAFYDSGTEVIGRAIKLDEDQKYEEALVLYRQGTEQLMTGLKYEKNAASRKFILDRINGYMKRAEDLKKTLSDAPAPPKSGAASGGSATRHKGDDSPKEDEEKNKMRGALASAIVSEKPNVKWTDIAGLEGAKEALKEAVILPIKFPQFFTGKRKPWKGMCYYICVIK